MPVQERTLDAVFRESAATSRNWFFYKTGNHDLADELTAAAFERLCIYYSDKPEIDVDKNLLHIINYGLLWNHNRTLKHFVPYENEQGQQEQQGHFSSPEDHSFAQLLNDHLRSLPKRERAELTLWLLRGLTVREIASILGGDYTRVSRRIARELKRLEKEVLNESIAV